MATLFQVPLQSNLPWYQFQITLSGNLYTLTMRFNTRTNRWILDIGDSANNPLVVGLPILIQQNVNGQYVVTGLPNGFFYSLDNSGKGQQPTLNSFQIDHTLYYLDESA